MQSPQVSPACLLAHDVVSSLRDICRADGPPDALLLSLPLACGRCRGIRAGHRSQLGLSLQTVAATPTSNIRSERTHSAHIRT